MKKKTRESGVHVQSESVSTFNRNQCPRSIGIRTFSAFAKKCSDRALSIYRDCLALEIQMAEMYQDIDDLEELYSDWEIRNVTERYRKCEKFKKKRGRYLDCVGRDRFGDDKWEKMFKD